VQASRPAVATIPDIASAGWSSDTHAAAAARIVATTNFDLRPYRAPYPSLR